METGYERARIIPAVSHRKNAKAAYLEAFEEHGDALFRHALFRLSNREKARDLTQETFLKTWDYLRTGKTVRSWKSFLYRVLNNLIVDEYRKTKEISLDTLFEEDAGNAETLVAYGSKRDVEEAFDERLEVEHVKELIAALPAHHATIITLRYIDGFSPKEIAAQMRVSENVVSVRIHRALNHLKSLFDDRYQ